MHNVDFHGCSFESNRWIGSTYTYELYDPSSTGSNWCRGGTYVHKPTVPHPVPYR